jgi:glycine oxidase
MGRSPEVVVVGAGVIGCAVAYELSRRGASVRVVEDRGVGMGATQASAGILAPHIEAEAAGPFLDLIVRGLGTFDRFLDQVASDGGSPVLYRRTGTLEVVVDSDGYGTLRRQSELLGSRGVPVSLLDGQAARAEEPQLAADVAGALLVPVHGFVAAPALALALAAAARRRGARFLDQGRASRIRPDGAGLIVETASGPISADTVVLAAGSWSGAIDLGGVRPPVRPVRGQLLYFAWSGPTLRRVIWGERCYIVPWDDGTVLVGATAEDAGFDERTTVAGVRDLIEAACELVPHAWNAGFVGARAGLRPATPDGFPIVGRSAAQPNLVYATGHFRNGILLAPLTAQLVADLIVDGRVDPALDPTDPGRFGL